MVPKENIGIECMTIHRVDQVLISADRNKASKIKFNRVVNSWIKGVESSNCNYSHFEALYSANLLVSGCYFHDAFEYGSGGRAYGSMLHFATSESRVFLILYRNLLLLRIYDFTERNKNLIGKSYCTFLFFV